MYDFCFLLILSTMMASLIHPDIRSRIFIYSTINWPLRPLGDCAPPLEVLLCSLHKHLPLSNSDSDRQHGHRCYPVAEQPPNLAHLPVKLGFWSTTPLLPPIPRASSIYANVTMFMQIGMSSPEASRSHPHLTICLDSPPFLFLLGSGGW